MTTPNQRRRDPQSLGQGWETAVATIGGVLLAAAFAALAGLGLASSLWGGGWVWPHGASTVAHTLGGLLHGHPGRGLSRRQQPLVAGDGAVYACVAFAELLLLALAVTTGVLITRYRRPGDARGGMATRSETELVLGRSRLRAAKAIIRPDLYPPRTGRHRFNPVRHVRRVIHSHGVQADPRPGTRHPRTHTPAKEPTNDRTT